jgi:predicted RNA-binding protein with PIN domain
MPPDPSDALALIDPGFLEQAVAAGRRALADLDEDQVPARLRKVAAYTGGRLPPPFVRRLLAELDRDPWLREQVVQAWPDADPDSPDPSRAAAALFVVRPPGWELRLGRLAGESAARDREGHLARLEARNRDLQNQLEVAERRLEEVQRELKEVRSDANRRVKASRGRLKDARASGEEAARAAEHRRAQSETERRRMQEELEEEQAKVLTLKAELLAARRSAAARESTQEPSVWLLRDPLEVARLLDDVLTAARPAASRPGQAAPVPAASFQLPAGVAPDNPKAIEWLAVQATPVAVVVDGYNVAFLLAAGRAPSGRTRARLDRELARLRRQAAAPMRIVTVYDSAHPGGVTAEPGPGGVEVRFTEAGRTADDEVVELAASLPAPVVVISSDRGVRERVEGSAALALWSEALAGWIRGRI